MTLLLKLGPATAIGPGPVSLRCPACGQIALFAPPMLNQQVIDVQGESEGLTYYVGVRLCPNGNCRTLVYVIRTAIGEVKACYPPITIDYDSTNVPAAVTAAFSEAITCHAHQCFVAAAIMVRKSLEELCRDRQATGKDLKERIRALGTKIVLPKDLLDGFDDLRLLGNDAAHIESKEFDQVGKEEVEVGIEFTKEVLKAVYQYSALLARLRSLKKTP